MAKAEIKGLAEMLKSLKDAEKTERIAHDILQDCGQFLAKGMSDAVESAANRGYQTGGLKSHIVPTEPKKNGNGYFVAVRPVGTDSKGVRNGEKYQYLEHGTKRGQSPRPELGKIGEKSEPKLQEMAQEIFNKHVK